VHPDAQTLILKDALALDLPARFHFIGSELGAKAVIGYHVAWANLLSRRAPAVVRGVVQLVKSVIRAKRAGEAVVADTTRPPHFLTSFVIEISVTRPAAAAEFREPSEGARLQAAS